MIFKESKKTRGNHCLELSLLIVAFATNCCLFTSSISHNEVIVGRSACQPICLFAWLSGCWLVDRVSPRQLSPISQVG